MKPTRINLTYNLEKEMVRWLMFEYQDNKTSTNY